MGIIVDAACTCGYRSGPLYVGPGVFEPCRYFFPSLCSHCHEVLSADVALDPPVCVFCDRVTEPYACGHLIPVEEGERVIYADPAAPDPAPRRLTSGRYPCPSCGAGEMSFGSVGFWD